jgi:hypothetical protein
LSPAPVLAEQLFSLREIAFCFILKRGLIILYKGENSTFGCEDFEDWFAFGEASDTEVSEALEECESKLERYKFSKPRLHMRVRVHAGILLNLYKRKMQNQYVRLNFPRKTFEKY